MKHLLIALTITLALPCAAFAGAWGSNPSAWENNQANWENNKSNWQNSPNNPENRPNPFIKNNTTYDNQGKPNGYTVEKKDGGVNYFDQNGNRKGYRPGR